jgi:metallo-beta-lactamase class B
MMRIFITTIICLVSFGTIYGQSGSSLKISYLTEDFYVFTTYNDYKGNRYPANGMYLLTSSGAVIFDCPWDTTQFQPLLDSIRIRHNKEVVLCISTHFHEDRTAGLEYYKRKGIKTYTTRQTDELSKKRGMKRAEFLIDNDTVFAVGQYSFQTFYPGQGHAPDNIVIWFEREKVLYGGCLIKSVEDKNLGNLADASTKEYARTVRNVQKKCKGPKQIIPGHNDWSSTESLRHTLKMAEGIERRDRE